MNNRQKWSFLVPVNVVKIPFQSVGLADPTIFRAPYAKLHSGSEAQLESREIGNLGRES